MKHDRSQQSSGNELSEEQLAQVAFVARQPIFDADGDTFGYELLFRERNEEEANYSEGTSATLETIANTLFAIGFDRLTCGQVAFVNATWQILNEQLFDILPPDRTVIELLETPYICDDLIDACRRARGAGYRLALDDVVDFDEVKELMPYVDIVKVDCLYTPAEKQRELFEGLRAHGITIVAEKVETQEIHDQSAEFGATLFQGYYYAKPTVMEGRRPSTSETSILRLLEATSAENADVDQLEEVIRSDASLSYLLLKYINSAAMGVRNHIESVRQAITLLGVHTIQRWAALVSIHKLANKGSRELLLDCIVRARVCESFAVNEHHDGSALDCFMIGLLSRFDAIMRMPMPDVLDDSGVNADIRAVLLNEEGASRELKRFHELTVACERGDWGNVIQLCSEMGQSQPQIAMAYYDALDWGNRTLRLLDAA